MHFIEYDYHELNQSEAHPSMDCTWDTHWRGRKGLKEDLSDEPLWPTISDYLNVPGRLLEAGCGTGQWVQFLGKLGHDVIGVDYAASGLEIGREHNPNLNLIKADFRNLPFEKDSFDYIVSFGAIEHDINGPEEALREFLRVLKPNGRFMCSVPCLNFYWIVGYPWQLIKKWLKCRKTLRRLWGKKKPFIFYQYVWSAGEYKNILNKCGWGVIDIRGYCPVTKLRRKRFFDSIVNKIDPLYSAHMMMAICRKL